MNHPERAVAGIACLLYASLLSACASVPPPAEPVLLIEGQLQLLDASTGTYQLVAAGADRAIALRTSHPARPAPLPVPRAGVVSIGNVSIPAELGRHLPPTSPSNSQESSR